MRSPKTTWCGVIGIAAGTIATFNFHPLVTKIAACAGTIASSVGLMFARDHRTKDSAVPEDKRQARLPLSVFVGALGLLLTGCASLQPGADPFVVRVEQMQTIAESGFDFILKTDDADRQFWRHRAPAFHDFCETLRAPVPVVAPGRVSLPRYVAVQWQLDRAKLDYKSARDASSSNALAAALISLQALNNQTAAWLTIITNTTVTRPPPLPASAPKKPLSLAPKPSRAFTAQGRSLPVPLDTEPVADPYDRATITSITITYDP